MISGIDSSGFSQSMASIWGGRSRPDPSRMAQELFSSTDADGSGAIDQEELKTALAAKSGDGRGPDAGELFAALDADGDGLVTEDEHEDGLAALHKDLAQASLMTNLGMSASSLARELFAQTDADGDGNITEEELAAAVAAKNGAGGGNVDAAGLFAALDADGDGLVTAAEHSDGLESLRTDSADKPMSGGQMPPAGGGQETFDAADTNQDGVVDATELAAAVAERNEATGADVDADEVLQSLDTDGDGLVSAAEFSARGAAGSAPAGRGGTSSVADAAQGLTASRYEMYRMMGADVMSSLPGNLFSARA